MQPNPIHLHNPSYPPSALAIPSNKIKCKRKKSHLVVEAVVWHSEPHSVAFSPCIFTWMCSLPWVTGLALCLWILLHYQYVVTARTPLGCAVVALCHGEPEALDLQDWTLHMDRVDQLIALVWFWMVPGLVSPPVLPHPHQQAELFSPAPSSSPNVSGSKGWSSCPGCHSPTSIPPSSQPPLLCYPG